MEEEEEEQEQEQEQEAAPDQMQRWCRWALSPLLLALPAPGRLCSSRNNCLLCPVVESTFAPTLLKSGESFGAFSDCLSNIISRQRRARWK